MCEKDAHINDNNIVLMMTFLFQSQEEVCDLKHAAPFQNIIPKPYIPFKGTSRTLILYIGNIILTLLIVVCDSTVRYYYEAYSYVEVPVVLRYDVAHLSRFFYRIYSHISRLAYKPTP